MRTSIYARKLGLGGTGVGSLTARYYVPSAFLREYVAILTELKYPILLAYAMLAAFIVLYHW